MCGGLTVVKQHRAYIPTPAPQEQIHARYAGESGPAIFLFHQWPISCRQMERLIPVLGDHMRVWGLDTPGYGVSPSTLVQVGFDDYVQRLMDAIVALKVDRFAVLGTEIGTGGVALSEGWPWLGLLTVFAVAFGVVGALAFGPLIDEAA